MNERLEFTLSPRRTVAAQLPKMLIDELERLAKESGRSRSSAIRLLLYCAVKDAALVKDALF